MYLIPDVAGCNLCLQKQQYRHVGYPHVGYPHSGVAWPLCPITTAWLTINNECHLLVKKEHMTNRLYIYIS